DEALEDARRADDAHWLARLLRRRARLHTRCGQFDRAEADYRRALELAEQQKLEQLAAWSSFEYAELMRQRGELKHALEAFLRAGRLAESLALASLRRTALAHLASCYVDR